MQTTSNNHFISQFYQRAWQIPNKPGWIIVYRAGQRPQPRAIRSTGSQTGLYSEVLEEQFKRLEDQAAKVIARVRQRLEINSNDRDILTRFTSTMIRRTPLSKERAKGVVRSLVPSHRAALTDSELLRLALAAADTPEEAYLNLPYYRARADQIFAEIESEPPDYFFHHDAWRSSELDELLNQMRWEFWTKDPTTSYEFVTSDYPAVLPQEGLLNRPRLIFPLSPEVCLVARDLDQANLHLSPIYKLVGRDRIKRINRAIISASWSEVYARKEFLSLDEVNRLIRTKVWFSPEVLPRPA